MKPALHKLFATPYCKKHFYNGKYSHQPKTGIAAFIKLEKESDGKPYRSISIYLKAGIKESFKLRDGDPLWATLERLDKINKRKTNEMQAVQQKVSHK